MLHMAQPPGQGQCGPHGPFGQSGQFGQQGVWSCADAVFVFLTVFLAQCLQHVEGIPEVESLASSALAGASRKVCLTWNSAARAMLACVLAAKNATMHNQDTRRSHLR